MPTNKPSLQSERDFDSVDEESHFSIVEQVPHVKKQLVKEVFFLAYSSLGAIYGDIGTSPLYVLNSIKYPLNGTTKEDIYGGVSLIFYLFIFIVLIKYAAIVLVYGPNEGEGGQVAIYAKLARCLHFGPKGVVIPGMPEKSDLELLKRTETTTSFISSKTSANSWRRSPKVMKVMSYFTLGACFLGCSLVMSDGLLTPTTSVLSAIAGIQVAKPDFSNVLVVSEVVLIFLFLIQQLGSHKISNLFAPIVLLWLIGLVICGVINITHHPAIFKALSPYYAINLLKKSGIDSLGGAMLAITGTEAMFADLGHFGKVPTQIGVSFVFLCLIITYLGQGAFLMKHPEALPSVFYLSIPGGTNSWAYWIMFVLATLATIIASQALILGVFSILSQMINLDCFPRLHVKHVSAEYAGKVYIPAANLLLLIGVCATTAGFKNSNNVTAAYGLGISLDFLVTSLLMVLCMIYVFEFPWYVATLFAIIFIPLEMCLVIANLKKVPHGAWFPLMMCAIFFSFFVGWRYCRDRTYKKQVEARVRISELFPKLKRVPANAVVNLRTQSPIPETDDDISEAVALETNEEVIEEKDPYDTVATRCNNSPLAITPGIAIIYSDTPMQDVSSPNSVPGVYAKIISTFASVPSIVVFCTLRVLSIPLVPEEERLLISPTKIPGHYKCILRYGFMEDVVVNNELSKVVVNHFAGTLEQDVSQNTQVLHIFENNKIRARMYSEEDHTRNPFVLSGRYLRKFLINHAFSPINAVFQYTDLYVQLNQDRESMDKLFVGGVMQI